ncbi:MAG TPA: cellulase family glycosylhydrolase, partial [bacterium]|nr:cellulase family glycosylhydrolase [bacterium]
MKLSRFSFLVGLVLFVAASTTQAAPPQLKVVGDEIVTASGGCTVRLTGVNIDSLEWNAAGDGPTGGGILAQVNEAIKYWNVNVIRIPLDQDWWDGNAQTTPTNRGSTSQAAYQGIVDSIVALCQTNNIYCDLDLQWSGDGPTGSATEQYSMPDENSLTFWTSVATRYANNTSVLFDTFNAPYPTSWSVWKSGGTT